MPLCAILRLILIIDQIWNNIGFADIDQKAVSYNDRPLQFSKGTVSFSQVTNFIEPIQWIELNIELSTLMVISATHHWIYGWLLLACIRIVGVVTWDNEVIHLLLKHLLACSILNVATCSTSPILTAHIILIILDSIFNTKVGVSIEVLPSRSELITCIEGFALLRHDTHWIDHHGEIFL